MILGVQIINFDIFDNDQAGILIDESISPAREGGKRANPMRKLNALIGRNNTGKTSFMGCLAYMKDCVTDGVTAASISCGRPGFSNMTPDKSKPSKFKVFFKLGDRETGKSDYIQYELSILANRFGTPVVSYEKAVRSTREEDGTYKMTTLLEVTDGEGFVLCPERDDGKTEEISLDDDHRTALSLFGKLRRYTHLCDLFHEMTHSTKKVEKWSKQRKAGGKFGDRDYAREELMAESTALVISKLFCFSPSIQKSSIAYIGGWIGALKGDTAILLDKELQADIRKAANFIINRINLQCTKPILPKVM